MLAQKPNGGAHEAPWAADEMPALRGQRIFPQQFHAAGIIRAGLARALQSMSPVATPITPIHLQATLAGMGTTSPLGPRSSAVRQTSTICSSLLGEHWDPGEFRTTLPHPVKDGADAPCQSHHRTLCTSAFGHLCGPASQPCRATPMDHNGSRSADGCIEFGALLADKAFDSKAIITDLDERGAKIVISQHSRRAMPRQIDAYVYKWRHLIERLLLQAQGVSGKAGFGWLRSLESCH